jgi:hypothetical protein
MASNCDIDNEHDEWLAEKRVYYWHKWWQRVVRRQLNASTRVPTEDLDEEVRFQEAKTEALSGK